jgi:hypothetical protein
MAGVMAALPPPEPGCASCAARDAVIGEQARVLKEQATAIRELRADVVALAAEVRELRLRLGRNSGSSMAPSADDLPGRIPPTAKPKRDQGTQNTYNAWPRSDISGPVSHPRIGRPRAQFLRTNVSHRL